MRHRLVYTAVGSALTISALVLSIGLLSNGSSAESSLRTPTHGTIPEEAFTETGLDMEKLPDLIAVADPKGGEAPVGYARKIDMFPGEYGDPELASQEYRLIPVYDATGTVLLGNVFPDYGFVPLDVSEALGFDINKLIETKTTVDEENGQP